MIKETLKFKTKWKAIVRDAKTGEVIRETEFKNAVLDQWRERIANALYGELDELGDTIDDLKAKLYLKYEQLGTDDTTAVSTDTDLITEDAGTLKQIASLSRDGAEVTILSFWDDGEAIGNWREFALYTEDMMAVVRANIEQDIANGETLTIEGKIKQE